MLLRVLAMAALLPVDPGHEERQETSLEGELGGEVNKVDEDKDKDGALVWMDSAPALRDGGGGGGRFSHASCCNVSINVMYCMCHMLC